MNIACSSNTYSGTWNVVSGTLLGSAANGLGTNSITVGTAGALETSYDINNPDTSLVLNGQMFLHQNDTFGSVAVNGQTLNAGTYTFAQLNSLYPTNFPATWTMQQGSSVSSGSGSITVGNISAPTTNASISQVTYNAGNLVIHGVNNNTPANAYHYVVLSSTNVALPLSSWTVVTTNAFNTDGTFDYTNAVAPGVPQLFLDVKVVP